MLKRKFISVLILIITFIYFSNITYASNQGIVYLSSNQEEVNMGEEIELTVNLENNKIAACNFYIYFDDEKLEFISNLNKEEATANTNLMGNTLGFVWFDALGGEGAKEGSIASFKFKAKEKGLVTFIIDGEYVIDLTSNLYMKKEEYYELYKVEELNVVKGNDVIKESEESKPFDSSNTLFPLLRNAIYKCEMKKNRKLS